MKDNETVLAALLEYAPRRASESLALESFDSAFDVLTAGYDTLCESGEAQKQALLLSLCSDIMRQSVLSELEKGAFDAPSRIEYVKYYFLGIKEKRCMCMYFGKKSRLVKTELLSRGRKILPDARADDIIEASRANGASSVCVAHNYEAGLSAADVASARRLYERCDAGGISLCDYITADFFTPCAVSMFYEL